MRKVSFKVSKRGTRYTPKPKPNPSLVFVDNEVGAPTVNYQQLPHVQNDVNYQQLPAVDLTKDDDDDDDIDEIPDADVSFIVNIFPDGYTIDKSFESNAAYQIASKYNPNLLHPYDRESESLFAAIECCRLPANFFDDIPCKYKNGKVACEVRDWRKDSSEPGVSTNGPSIAATPSIRRISLQMSMDSIVRDIPQIFKRDLAYGELVEAEAKILLALHPKIDLHPYPNFDRLCKKPKTVKLNLDFRAMRRKRLRQMFVPENTNLGTDDPKPMMDQPSVVNLATQNVGQRPAMDQPHSVNLATQNADQRPAMDQTNSVNLATQNAGQRTTMDQPSFVNLASQNVGQRSMGQPNVCNLATQNVGQGPAIDQTNSVNLATQNAGQRTTMDQPNFVNLASQNVGLRSMGQPNVCNLATQNVGQGPAMDQTNSVNLATQNVSQRPTLDQPNVVNLATQNVGRRPTLDQPNVVNLATQHLGQRLAMDQPNLVNLATQNVGQCNTTVPSPINHAPDTSIPTFPWVSHQPKDQFGVETHGHMQSNAPGTAFNAPGASSNALVNLSSGNDDINSYMSAFEGDRENQDGQSSSMANSDYINLSNPLSFVGNQQQQIASHNALGASSIGASSTNAMQSSSSIMSAFDYKWGNQDRQSSSMAKSNIGNLSDPTCSMSFPSTNHGIMSHVSAFDSRSRSNSLVYLGNQQQQLASHMQYNASRTSVNAPGASSIHGMASLNANNGGISSIIPFDGSKGNQDGHSSSVANMDNRNWSNPLAEVFNQHQLIPLHNRNTTGAAFSAPGLDANMQYNASQTAANVPGASSVQGTVSLSLDDDGIQSIMDAFESKRGLQDGNCPPMANYADNNQSNPLAFVGYQQQQIAASHMQNQQHGVMSSGSDNDDLWSIVSAFDNKRGHQDGQSSSVANLNKRNRLNPLDFSGDELQQMGSSHMVSSNAPDSRWKNTLVQQQSTGGVVQIRSSSLPPKSGEFSSGQRRMQIRAAVGSSSHRGKSVVNSVPAVGGSRSSSSGTNNSMHPRQMAATLGSKPLPTIPSLSGVGSSSSVGNASCPPVASGAIQKPLLTIPILSGIGSSSNVRNTSGPNVASGAVQRSLTIPILSGIRSSSNSGNTSGRSVASGAVQKPLPTIPILSGIGSSSSVGDTSGPSVASAAVQRPLTIPILSGIRSSSNSGNTSGPSIASGAVQKPLSTIPILSGIGSSRNGNTSGPSDASVAVQKPLLTIPILSGIRSSSSIANTSGPSIAIGAPRSGPRGVSPLPISNPNPGPSSITTINNAVLGLQSDNLQVPSGSGSRSRGRGSRGRPPRGRAPRGRVPVGLGSGISRASDMNQMQPASVSPSVSSGASLPSVSANNQEGARSNDWIDEDFIRSLMK